MKRIDRIFNALGVLDNNNCEDDDGKFLRLY